MCKEGGYMLTDRKLRIAWQAYLAELAAKQMAEHPSGALVAERLRKYLCLKQPEFSLRIVPGWQRC